ncbi:MAG: MerR family transcriptional regulator [Atopobiaceae bacterium]|nr:MerR family transcriptional regulator [Olsenella sp.]MBQ6491185.1 MerR family transcriptional regulator [Atopobiaceae bacterium]
MGTYTVHQLADLAGTSVRALHHYEDQGLLHPHRRPNGYREYGPADVERLQQVLVLRACGMPLGDIRDLLGAPGYDARSALEGHLVALEDQRRELDALIMTVRRTIDSLEGDATMTDSERFEGLKRKAVDENERRFGAEARGRHGDDAVDAANERLLAMDEATWNDLGALEGRIIELLGAAMATGDPASPEADALCKAHVRWVQLHWGEGAWSPQAHLGLAHGYLADDRFVEYYDSRAGAGATEFLVRALESSLG